MIVRETEVWRIMGVSRGGAILAVLAIAWLQPAVGVKEHVSALNDTGHPVHENEVSFTSYEPDDQHPHQSPGKPTKFDMNMNQLIQTDDKLQYQIEASRMENATSSPIGWTDCQDDRTTPCVRKELSDLLDRLSGMDAYNVTDSVQIIRNRDVARTDEKGNVRSDASLLDKVRRYAREHVIKIRLSKDLISGRKARTFFNGESTERCSSHAFVNLPVPASRMRDTCPRRMFCENVALLLCT